MCDCVLRGGVFLTKTQHKELKKTLSQYSEHKDIDEVIAEHNARIDREVKASKRDAAKLSNKEDVLNYVRHKAFSPDNVHWSILEDKLIRYKEA